MCGCAGAKSGWESRRQRACLGRVGMRAARAAFPLTSFSAIGGPLHSWKVVRRSCARAHVPSPGVALLHLLHLLHLPFHGVAGWCSETPGAVQAMRARDARGATPPSISQGLPGGAVDPEGPRAMQSAPGEAVQRYGGRGWPRQNYPTLGTRHLAPAALTESLHVDSSGSTALTSSTIHLQHA
jgi:hypothetical protein